MSSCCVILGHARSGSTGFARAISRATDTPFLMEPFHKRMHDRGIDFSSPGFDGYLAEVMSARIIKHLWNGLSPAQNARILSHPQVMAIVLLERRNLVSTALSAVVATAHGEWGPRRGSALTVPISMEKVERHIRSFSKGQRRYRTWLHESRVPHFALTYEDLYDVGRDDAYRARILSAVCAYFGLPAVNLEAGLRHLHPRKRYNSNELYRTAPNWAEFEARFLKPRSGKLLAAGQKLTHTAQRVSAATGAPLVRAVTRAWCSAGNVLKLPR